MPVSSNARISCLALAAALFALWGNRIVAADGEADASPDKRVAWKHTEKDVTVTIYPVADKRWTAHRTDGKKPVYQEIERTKDHIILQNQDTKLFIRLETDWAYWRRPREAKWTRWTRGAWIDEIPEGDPLVTYTIPDENAPKPKKKKKKGKGKAKESPTPAQSSPS